jgi:hypothetical protein
VTTTRHLLATAAAAAVGAALVALTAGTLAAGTRPEHKPAVLWLTLACWAAFIPAVILVRSLATRVAVPLVLTIAVALQVTALRWAPRTSDDVYRYAWDGHVGNHGIDPYAYAPQARQLDPVRLGWLFPAGRPPLINRPDVPTIYPPIAQLWFRLVDLLTPDSWQIHAFQVAGALVALAGAGLLMLVLRAGGQPPGLAVAWAWCPLVVFEAGNDGHVDVLAAVLTVGALWLVARGRAGWAGAVLGLAIGVKVIPVLVVPAALRRRPLAILGAACAVLVGTYLPHLLSVGRGVVGFLPTYLGEEGYDDGDRFGLLHLVMPHTWTTKAAVLVLAGLAGLVYRRTDPVTPWRGATLMVGVALLLATPTYPWYALVLVALAVAADRLEWLAVAAGGYVVYLGGWTGWQGRWLQTLAYGSALLIVLTVSALRWKWTPRAVVRLSALERHLADLNAPVNH